MARKICLAAVMTLICLLCSAAQPGGADFTETGYGIEMVYVEAGTFTMGCKDGRDTDCSSGEKPAHQVTLTKDFHIGKTEVTQGQWKAVMGSNPSDFKGDDLPVETVSLDDVQEFIKKLNVATGKKYRLPTEAEWEYAARGGNRSEGYLYSGSNMVDDVAWYWENSSSKTHAAGTKRPNELGLYDMSGNVQEWCQDWYAKYSGNPQTDPEGPATGSYRVLRGWSWSGEAKRVRVSYRIGGALSNHGYTLGFRLALSSR